MGCMESCGFIRNVILEFMLSLNISYNLVVLVYVVYVLCLKEVFMCGV